MFTAMNYSSAEKVRFANLYSISSFDVHSQIKGTALILYALC